THYRRNDAREHGHRGPGESQPGDQPEDGQAKWPVDPGRNHRIRRRGLPVAAMTSTVHDTRTYPIEGEAAPPVHHAQTGMTLGVKAITFIAVILLSVGAVLSWH